MKELFELVNEYPVTTLSIGVLCLLVLEMTYSMIVKVTKNLKGGSK